MHVELQATCSALGYLEGNRYVKEPDCLETVKDLIRFLKREDETCDIRRQLGHAQIVQKDLVPLVKQYHEERQLFETLIRVLVNLTQPAIICFKNAIPADKTMYNYYLEVEAELQGYKEVFVDEDFFSTLTERLGQLLKLDWEHRQEEDRLLIERILILIRNILHVPPNQDQEQRTDDDATIHDQVIWAIHCSGLEDLLLYIASSEEERQFSMHVLEIVSLMFREQTPEVLACAGVQRSQSQKEKDERELEMIREQERVRKVSDHKKFSTRHSRFGGTYVVKNMKSISERDVIFHKAQHDVSNLSFDVNKKPKKIAKNRQPIKDKDLVRRSTLSIRLGLKEFCVQFLENCYNPLMYAVKDVLNHERTQEHDETYYLWSIRFFMEFCRHHSKRVELVSETMSVQAFHYIQVQMIQYYEMQMMEKKEAIVWGKRVHLALKAYQELLLTLDAMDRSKNPQLMESSKVLKGNIFYMMEFRDIFLTLLRKFNQSQQSRTYLKDLVETTHLFLKMLDNETQRNSHLVVQSKKKKNKKRQKKDVSKENIEPQEHTPQQLEDMWDDLSTDLSSLFQGRGEIPTDVSPFDAASEIEEEQQRVNAMISIQDALRHSQPGNGIALLRAAREIWPERNEFGSVDISPEEEFMALREIFMATLPRAPPESQVEETTMDGYEEGAEVEEEETRATSVSEQEFNFKEFVNKFSSGNILKCYVLLLADFDKNTTHTNHCVIKMLHRVSVDLGHTGLVFQASLFRLFQRILLSPLAKLDRYKELVKFSTFTVRNFVETAEKNPKAFMELLFWKSSKEASELVDGYGTYQSKGKVLWTEELETEVRHLFEEYRDQDDSSKDVVDCIMERITDPEKTRGQVLRELKKQGLIGSVKDIKRKKAGGQPGPWTEEEEFDLANLYDRFHSTNDPLGSIMSHMEVKRSKTKVIEKLFSLGLVKERKELYKRRQRKRGGSGSDSDDDIDRMQQREDFQELPSDFEEEVLSSGDEGDVSGDDDKKEDEARGRTSNDGGQDDMAAIITDLVAKGYNDQIKWIQRGLSRTAGDKEESASSMPVPIVPLTEENETAMEDECFLSFLKKIGICPPSSEQEMFWRIPGDWSPAQLRQLVEGLTLDEQGVPSQAHTIKVHRPPAPKPSKKKVKEAKKKDNQKTSERMERLKAIAKQRQQDKGKKPKRDRTRKRRSASPPVARNDSDDDVEFEGQGHQVSEVTDTPANKTTTKVTPPSKKKSRIRRIQDSDSEDSDAGPAMPADDETAVTSDTEASQSQKRPLDLGDSSDDDEPLQPAKRARIPSNASENNTSPSDSDSDVETPAQPTKSVQMQSDSDSDDDVPLASKLKQGSFPATQFSLEMGDNSDSELDDHIPLRQVLNKKNRIESDEED
ncbi:protein timeless homolog isoform X2 [Pecten maximus]|uniref:protein timeless homolog isoform X2 n=1 Tax=Pecten maximus TaxID=6579 RepID=UPI00145828D8|nr:protein timeless homolog isoform X2 [Pecten maximus]